MTDGGFLALLAGDSISRFVFFPTLAALPLLFLGRTRPAVVRWYALAVSLVELGLVGLYAAAHWDPAGMVAGDPVIPWIELPGLSIV